MKNRINICFFFFHIFFLSACYEPQIETFADYRKEFAVSLKNLHTQVVNIEQVSMQSFKNLHNVVSNRSDFEDLYQKLPVRVQEIRSQLKIVEDKLFYVQKNVDKYFEKLEEGSKTLSVEEQKAYQTQEQVWEKLKQDIMIQIDNIEILIKHTEDLRRLLVLAEMKKDKGQVKEAIVKISQIYVEDFTKLKKDIEKAYLLIENTKRKSSNNLLTPQR